MIVWPVARIAGVTVGSGHHQLHPLQRRLSGGEGGVDLFHRHPSLLRERQRRARRRRPPGPAVVAGAHVREQRGRGDAAALHRLHECPEGGEVRGRHDWFSLAV